MSELAIKDREEKLAQIALPEIDCACIDKRTRKILIYLVNKELKTYRTYPTAMVEGAEIDLMELRHKIENCDFMKTSKKGRKLSDFNIHMKQCVSSRAKGGEGKPFKQCVELWKEKKQK